LSSAPALRLVTEGGGPVVDDRALADLGRDDIGNSERLRFRHGEDLRRTPGLGTLVFIDGKRWRLDPENAEALKRAQLTARAIELEAKAVLEEAKKLDGGDEGDEDEDDADDKKLTPTQRKKKQLRNMARTLMGWRTQSSNSARLSAMLTQSWPHLHHDLEAWNAKPNLFNVENGTLEFDGLDKKLREHRREDYLTHMAGVAYDENAQCPEFRAFLDRVLPPAKDEHGNEDRALQGFVQRALGACLIDSVRDQAMVVFHGGGANGKSTLLNAVARVLGSYCMTVAVQTLLYSEQSGSSASPDVARLAERPRMIRVSEPEPGAKLSEGGVKSLTGGEPIVARKLHEAPVEFHIVGKIILSCNNRPSIRGGDDGIWRRILLVPWKVQIPPEEQREKGPALEAALEREAPGILNWLIDGLSDYFERGGLDPPESVLAETLAYRTDSDVIGRFIAECCVKSDGARVDGAELYDAFKAWSKDEGMKEPLSANMVGRRLTDRGFGREKSCGAVIRIGLDLTDEWKQRVRAGVFGGDDSDKGKKKGRDE